MTARELFEDLQQQGLLDVPIVNFDTNYECEGWDTESDWEGKTISVRLIF